MFRRWYWLFVFGLFFYLPLPAENGKYVLGTNVNLTAGGTNFIGLSTPNVSQPSQPSTLFYAVYPTVTLTSNGTRSNWTTSYSYGLERTDTEPNYKHESHAGSLGFSSRISPAWTISLSDSFNRTSDATTFNAFRNVTADPASPFVFYPVSTLIPALGNSASLGVNYRFTDRSSLSIALTHTLREYGNGGTGAVAAALANQQSFSGDIKYNYQTGKYEKWSLGYNAAYFNFSPYSNVSRFQNAYSQAVYVGYANEFVPGLTLDMTAGVSLVQGQLTAANYAGYNSTANLRKTIHNSSVTNSSFAVYFRQASGDTSGLGSLSSTRSGGASFTLASRKVTAFADASAFDTQGTLDNTYNAQGYAATANLGIPLTRNWSAQVGGQFQRYKSLSAFDFTQKRVFISLRYSNPSLKKF